MGFHVGADLQSKSTPWRISAPASAEGGQFNSLWFGRRSSIGRHGKVAPKPAVETTAIANGEVRPQSGGSPSNTGRPDVTRLSGHIPNQSRGVPLKREKQIGSGDVGLQSTSRIDHDFGGVSMSINRASAAIWIKLRFAKNAVVPQLISAA